MVKQNRRPQEREASMKTEVKERTSQKEASVLGPGTPAPDFKLRSTPDQFVSLSDFRGQPVILAFYPADWSPCAAISWPCTTRYCRSFRSSMLL
jgi:hypothetical protein